MKKFIAVCITLLVASVAAAPAFADAPSPKTITGTTVVNSDGSRTLTVSGTYGWEKKCDPKKPDGYAISWNDPTAPGNVVANGIAVGTPTDNTIHATNGCAAATYGPLSHTYPASVNTALQVCVVTYHNKDTKKTAGGPNRQTDNSVEENDDGNPMVCLSFLPPPPPPPTDVCPNIEGVQTSIPGGMTKDANGNCITPPVTPPVTPPAPPTPPTTITVTVDKVTVDKVIVNTVVIKKVVIKKTVKPKAKPKCGCKHKPKPKPKPKPCKKKPHVLPHTR